MTEGQRKILRYQQAEAVAIIMSEVSKGLDGLIKKVAAIQARGRFAGLQRNPALIRVTDGRP